MKECGNPQISRCVENRCCYTDDLYPLSWSWPLWGVLSGFQQAVDCLNGIFRAIFQARLVFPLPGQKRACQCVPGPVAFPLSLPGLDRASSVLPWGQRSGFFGPMKTLGQSGPTGARGVVMNKGRVSPRLESISAAHYFIKLAARL